MNYQSNPRAFWPRRLVRSWVGHPIVDLIIAVLVCLVIDQTTAQAPGTPQVRDAALQTMVGVCVGAIAFAVTGTSILLAVPPGQRLQNLLAEAGYDLTHLVMVSVATLSAAAVALSCTIAFESSSPGWLLPTVELWFGLIGAMAQFRLVWLFYQIFILLAMDRPESSG